MRKPRAANLRVIVKMISPPPKPYAWTIVDDTDGCELIQSSDRFRTSLLAWDAGVSALAHRIGS
jgi:hypothetical protein